jgi:hypothetical protein
VVGFTTGSRGKVPGKTCEKRKKIEIIITTTTIITNNNGKNNRYIFVEAIFKKYINLICRQTHEKLTVV